MKEIIGRLSRGIYEYEIPIIMSSVSIIELKIGTGIIYNGSFELFSANELELKGIAYSTNEKFIILNNQFIGKVNKINFKIVTEFTEIRDQIKGNINIVSNGGEIVIPYDINVEPDGIETTLGTITNLAEFTQLVINNYDEALRVFYSQEFEKNLLAENPKYNSVYKGLIKSTDRNVAMEEFLVFCDKKNKVTLSLSEYEKTYTGLTESYGECFILKKEHWGYAKIEVQIKGNFLTTAKMNISSDMFAGNCLEINYYINHNKLINGINTGKIIFKTHNQTLEHVINVDNRREKNVKNENIDKYLGELYRYFLRFKLGKIQKFEWAKESFEIIDLAENSCEASLFLELYKAQILLEIKDQKEASRVIENVGSELIGNKDRDIELYCYFLYLRTLEKNDPVYTHEISQRVREYYENGYDSYIMLLIMLFMDEKNDKNPSLIYARLKEQYSKGCRSPLIYFEALKLLNKSPELLRVFNGFELQVLNFGAKNQKIEKDLANQLTEVALGGKECKEMLIRVLNYLFDIYSETSILEAICSLLIREQKSEAKYFKWYEAGVKANLKITKLYEYYMFSISTDYMDELPQSVLLYFLYNANVLYDKQSFLYYNIVVNKEKLSEIYRNYIKRIEKYATENMSQGNIDEFLAVIYKRVLNKTLINSDIIKKLPEIVHTYKIECENENVRKVIVCHKELNEEKETRILNGEAYVNIYSKDSIILFEDFYGRRYIGTVDYRLEKLFNDDEFIKFCIEYCSNNKYLIMAYTKSVLRYTKDHFKVLNVLKNCIDMEEFSNAFEKSIMQDVVEYYYDNYDNEILDEYLVLFNKSKMNTASRTKIMELMIIRGMYDEAYNLFVKFGIENVDPSKVVKFCTRMFDRKGTDEDPVLLGLCIYAFRNGKYNEEVLKFLSKYYYGLTKEMLDLWQSSVDFEYENRELEERLVVQILFTRTYLNQLTNLYDFYYKKGAVTEIKRAYLFFKSCEFYIKNNLTDDKFFKHLENEIGEMHNMEDMCKIAYTKICSDLEELSLERQKKCNNIIFDLSNKKIRLPFFKKFAKWFDIPYSLRDKYFVEYKANPKNRVSINYVLEKGRLDEKNYENETMTSICSGIFLKEFILFYGENVQYYIIEESAEEEVISESSNLSCDDDISGDESRYGYINNMMLSKDLRDDKTFMELAENYSLTNEIINKLFNIV